VQPHFVFSCWASQRQMDSEEQSLTLQNKGLRFRVASSLV